MRVIKFRGKRVDNGEWVVGSLSIEYDGECHISYWESQCTDATVNLWEPVEMWYEVIPETVGQFTGLKDKNGEDVYEGDLYTPSYGDEVYPVMFISGAFVGGNSPAHCQPLGWEDDCIDIDLWFSIVGNIHDNPELLTPSQKGDVNYNMNNNFDPNAKAEQEKSAAEAESAAANAQESAAQDSATGAESEEVTEG